MKQLKLLLAGLLISTAIWAQDDVEEKPEPPTAMEVPPEVYDSAAWPAEPAVTDSKVNNFGGFKILIGGGLSQIDHSNFNTMAALHSFPLLRENVLGTFNFGFLMREKKKRFFFDVMGTFILSSRQKTNSYKLRQQQSSVDLNFNYALLDNRTHSFYPSLGIGFLSNSVNYEANMNSLPFGQSMTTVSGERNYVSNWNMYLNPHLVYDFKIGKSKRGAIQLRAGYRVGINQATWRVGNERQKLDGAPKSTANGFYAALCLAL